MNKVYQPALYTIIVTTAGPEAYFKIGISGDVALRVDGVQTGCPLPIDRILYLNTGSMGLARALERALHRRFRAFHTSGEWFLFDITNEAHKAEFHDGCAEVIDESMPGWKWEAHDETGFRRLRAELKAQLMDPAVRLRERNQREVDLALDLTRVGRGHPKSYRRK